MNEIRMYKDTDIDEVVKLFLSVFGIEPWNDKWPDFETAKSYILENVQNPNFIGYVMIEDENIIGVSIGRVKTWWQGKEYLIEEFFIDNSYQGKGLGSKLMSFINNDLKKEEVKNIVLLTDKDTEAFKFYKKRGFKEKSDMIFMYRGL